MPSQHMTSALRATIYLLLAVLASATPARAQGPLVDVDWLKANLGKPGLVVLDVRPVKALYLSGHIPGAVFTDYAKDGWREKNKAGVDGMLPEPEKVEKLLGALGIDNGTHVVVVPDGRSAQDVGVAARLYWTFKVMGHDKVSLLDGGHAAWVRDVDKDRRPLNPLETTDVRPPARTFKASLRAEMIVSKADVEKALASNTTLVDNRPPDFYQGLTMSPAAKRAGTLPGAKSVPEAWLTRNNGGFFRSPAQLATLYKTAGVSTAEPHINFCNTGHWASLGWFVSSEILGNKAARMYDGSMAEWTQDPNAPVERKIAVD